MKPHRQFRSTVAAFILAVASLFCTAASATAFSCSPALRPPSSDKHRPMTAIKCNALRPELDCGGSSDSIERPLL